MKLLIALFSLLQCASAADLDETNFWTHSLPQLVDIDGLVHQPLNNPEVRAIVLVFILPDCPISNSYLPELNRIHSEFGTRGVQLFTIHVDQKLSLESARQHAREHQLRPPVVLDPRHVWVRKVGATVSPEVAVLSPTGKMLYIGRIDNRYAGLGKRRAQITSHDLRDALNAILAGQPVAKPRTQAVGCNISDTIEK